MAIAHLKPMKLSARQNDLLRLRLTSLREALGISERTLADLSGISVGAVRSIGQTEGGPTLGTMIGLMRGLGLSSLDQLLGASATDLILSTDDVDRVLGESVLETLMKVKSPGNGSV